MAIDLMRIDLVKGSPGDFAVCESVVHRCICIYIRRYTYNKMCVRLLATGCAWLNSVLRSSKVIKTLPVASQNM